ncbi:MAG: SOS response-associated peptidase [Cyclobacteriaceae bacterium]
MCYHKSLTAKYEQLAEYYSTSHSNLVAEMYSVKFHENGFDFQPGPVVTAGKPSEIQMFRWGLVPFWVKDLPSATRLKISTLNCISKEMFEKPSYRDAAKEGKRCLIPCSGFFEWRWMDEKGKTKIPYFISLKDQPIFSLAGLYSRWMDKTTDQAYYSYTVLTTTANAMMSTIHNTKQRMPVILPREYEKDWLNRNLSKDDVLALCQPIDDGLMTAHTISKRITSKKEETNVPEILDVQQYEELNSK